MHRICRSDAQTRALTFKFVDFLNISGVIWFCTIQIKCQISYNFCMKRRIAAPKERMTYELLKELFRYDPDTGLFWWRARTQSNIRPIEIVAGNVHKQGYIAIHVRGYGYLAHRLAWLYMTEKWPDREIDHIDLNKANNSFGNLREADPKQNCANRPVRADSKSGIKGIIRRNNRWRAVISVDGKRRSLGYFDTPEEAHAVYAAALKAQAGEFARAH